MTTPTTGRLGSVAALLIGTGLLAGCVTGYDPRDYDGSPPTSGGSSAVATTSPSTAPATAPAATPAASSAASPTPGSATHVVLAQATGKNVTIDIEDETRTLVSARSGPATDGASVDPYKLVITNDDPQTLRLTWVGGPCDSANSLSIDATAGQFLLVQPECSGDSIVTDRILILTFSKPIDASTVRAVIQDGLDT